MILAPPAGPGHQYQKPMISSSGCRRGTFNSPALQWAMKTDLGCDCEESVRSIVGGHQEDTEW